jgi:hypothetical protein
MLIKSEFDKSEAIIVGTAKAKVNHQVETSTRALLKFHLTSENHSLVAAYVFGNILEYAKFHSNNAQSSYLSHVFNKE